MWSKAIRIGGGVAALATAGTLVYNRGDELRVRTAQLLVNNQQSTAYETFANDDFNELFPRGYVCLFFEVCANMATLFFFYRSWRYNWDHRAPAACVNPVDYANADEEKRKELLKAETVGSGGLAFYKLHKHSFLSRKVHVIYI